MAVGEGVGVKPPPPQVSITMDHFLSMMVKPVTGFGHEPKEPVPALAESPVVP